MSDVLGEVDPHDVPDVVREAVEADRVAAVIGDGSRVLQATTPYLDMVGFTRAELDAGELSWMRLTPPESLTADARAIGEARATGRARPYEKTYVRRDGSPVHVLLSLLLVTVEPLRLFAVVAEQQDAAGRALCEALGAG